jgi:hypothetical protein
VALSSAATRNLSPPVNTSIKLFRPIVAVVAQRKQVYKITYPNGMIYVGLDLTGSVTYFGSPSAKARIAADLGEHVNDYTARKTILWECETATDAEARAKERELIVATRANDPAIGYNVTPRFRPATGQD